MDYGATENGSTSFLRNAKRITYHPYCPIHSSISSFNFINQLLIFNLKSLPTEARTDLLLVDVSNLLLCVAQLLPSICDSANDLTGNLHTIKSKILRDIHVKCQELYSCLLLRGATLDTLHKVSPAKN